MLVLWFIGPPLEEYFGHGRYLLVYLVSGLAGSAGALIWSPNALTVGASGAIWGIMGAALVLEARRIYVFGGQAMGLVVFNLVITFVIPGISIGGHIGGLIGGAAVRARVLEPAAHRRRSRRSSVAAVGVAERRASRSRRSASSAADRDGGDARLGERRLRRGEPRERHAVRRAGDVVEPEPVAERDRARLAAVLAADPELDARLRASPALDRDPHEVADPVLVEHLERVPLEDAVLEVVREELALRVVAREAERRLREVVRPEGEEVGLLGDLVGAQRSARELDHRPAEVLDRRLLGRDALGELAEPGELLA